MCHIRDIVAVAGEQIRPYLTYLPGLADLMGRSGSYVAEWVRQFYASLWIDPGHRFIHFAVGGRDHRLYGNRAREILMVPDDSIKLHQVCYGQTAPPRRPHGGAVPPIGLVRPCFREPFGEGSRRTPGALTPVARVLDALMRRTLLPRGGYREGLTRFQLWLIHHLISQTPFDIWDLMLCEMEDTLVEGLKGHR